MNEPFFNSDNKALEHEELVITASKMGSRKFSMAHEGSIYHRHDLHNQIQVALWGGTFTAFNWTKLKCWMSHQYFGKFSQKR